MELNELYNIIGTAIMLITEIILGYCIIKLVKIFYYEIVNEDSKLNKIIEKNDKKRHFKKHLKKWLRDEELEKEYSNFYDYYEIQYNKQYLYDETYKELIRYKNNTEIKKW